MDSVLPSIPLAAAGLLAAYVCVRSFLRVLPHAITWEMRRLQDSTEREVARRKLPHGQQHLANTSRLMATKRRLLDRLHARWRTGTAAEVHDQSSDPEWSRLVARLDEVDRELDRQEELARNRYREATEQAVAGFDRSVRRLRWLSGADLVLFLTSGAVVIWVVATL